jgi:hypothetical protein
MKKTPKNAEKYNCTECNFNCSKKSEYNRHILTAKHKNRTNRTEKSPKNAEYFECNCGKVYKARNSLWYHKQKCNIDINTNTTDIAPTPQVIQVQDPQIVSIMDTLIKENADFKKLLIEQNSQIMEVAKNSQIINNNTTNNNNQFNLNFFLNDTCKDAMNITDFLGNLDVQIDEIEYIGHHGYVNGMTKMIMERLKGMDITKRPIHCTDIKRETMYIKDKDEWSKDTEELTKLRKILNRVTMNNCRTVPKWKSAHPDCEIMETRNNEFCYKMMRLMLGDVEDAQIKLDNKIIKTMSKELYVNKNKA